MKVQIKLFSALRQGRPKVTEMDLEPGATPAMIAGILNIKPAQVAVVVVNGTLAASDTRLNDGDIVSLLPPISGG